ncbi:hypothetical protein JCM30237_28090 [Halolamina litorea]|uniref:Twin-arginine translocation signal domain-containing protein n=1 Tax=Halolamina litorea TaxID=1515593 RepID=A0ABD6BU09_9EURY|nr:twin-arginine translocation signal domain-containing protein [Halolamina litorea]
MIADRQPSRRRFLAGVAAGTVLGLAGCSTPGTNFASYSTVGDSVDGLDYAGTLDRARSAGYTVEAPFYVNARLRIGLPADAPALTSRFGDDARVVLTQFRYSETRFVEADFTGSEAPRLVIFDEELGFEQPFRPTNLPPDDWLREQFALLFPDGDAAAFVADAKEVASRAEENYVSVSVEGTPDFEAVTTAFEARAAATTTSETQGDGWITLTYAADGAEFGSFAVVVPSAQIGTRDSGHRYEIKLDRAGGFRLQVRLPAGEEMPESEYRAVFREMFEALGLPADRVAGYEFEYSPSVW